GDSKCSDIALPRASRSCEIRFQSKLLTRAVIFLEMTASTVLAWVAVMLYEYNLAAVFIAGTPVLALKFVCCGPQAAQRALRQRTPNRKRSQLVHLVRPRFEPLPFAGRGARPQQ